MNILEALNIPLIAKQRVPIKTLIAQMEPSNEQKKLIESHIAAINLVSVLNEQTLRIRSFKDDNYSYQVIYVLEIELKKIDSIVSLSELLHSAFPEPTLLVLNSGNKSYLSVATKRINKNDNTKTVVEDSIVTEIIHVEEHLDFSNLSFPNLKEYYEEIVNIVYKYQVFNLIKVYPVNNLNFKQIIRQYESVNANIKRLKAEYKQASMMADRMRIDDEIYDEEEKISIIIKHLKGVK